MKTYKTIFFTLVLMNLLACGSPALIDRASGNGSANDGTLPNGQAEASLVGADSTIECSNIRTNLNYASDLDTLEITIFGTDDSGEYSTTLYLVIYDFSTFQSGDSVTVDSGFFSGSATYSTVDEAASASFYPIESGSVEINEICIDSESCANSGSYTFTYTNGSASMTVTGDYSSNSLYLE